MRLPLSLAVLALLIGLGGIVALRLSDAAVTMIAGVTCGIVTTVPVSIGLLIALTRPSPYTGGGEIEVRGNRWTGYRTIQESSEPIIMAIIYLTQQNKIASKTRC